MIVYFILNVYLENIDKVTYIIKKQIILKYRYVLIITLFICIVIKDWNLFHRFYFDVHEISFYYT
jgi:hypothetical protein